MAVQELKKFLNSLIFHDIAMIPITNQIEKYLVFDRSKT